MKHIKLFEKFRYTTKPWAGLKDKVRYNIYDDDVLFGHFIKNEYYYTYDIFYIDYLQLEDQFRGREKNNFKTLMDEIVKIAKSEDFSEIQLKPDSSTDELYDKLFGIYYEYGFRPKDDEYEGMFLQI